MFLHVDDFSIYDTPKNSGSMDTTWLEGTYDVRQSTTSNLLIKDYNGRIGLGTRVATTGRRSIYYSLGRYLTENDKVNINQKLYDYTPNGVAIGGISIVDDFQEEDILAFGFSSKSQGFVTYVGEDGLVKRDSFNLVTSLSGSLDVIEWGFIKSYTNRSDKYDAFTLWVNNKPAYIGNVFCQVGARGAINARIHGGVNTLNVDTPSQSKFITNIQNVTIPVCGTSDLAITSGERLGFVRVLSRRPTADLGPNSMTGSAGGSHYSLLDGVPSEGNWVQSTAPTDEELFLSTPFDNLSNEAILTSAIRIVASKNNPFALDLEGTMRINGVMYDVGETQVDLLPGMNMSFKDRNPRTGLTWTSGEINAAAFGFKVV